jgi:hypothetical protein
LVPAHSIANGNVVVVFIELDNLDFHTDL